MGTKHLAAECPSCGFPVAGSPGQQTSCPNCGISGTISGVTIPTTLFWATITFIAGVIISPYLKRQVARVQ